MKRQLPLMMVFVFGFAMIIQYFIPHQASEWVNAFLMDWMMIIGVFALALGIWSLIKVSWDKIKYKKPNWEYAIVTLAGLFLMIFFGFDYFRHFSTPIGSDNYMYVHFYRHIVIPIQSTMFSLLAFFIASAAYRAFRARSLLATLLLIAALVIMLRFNPLLGPIQPIMEKFSVWLLNVPNLAAKRAIVIGVGLGMVATALKVILGIERAYLGKD
ncbi:MAG: hypothetical protein DRP46_01280 [Candidatus Zixiibacteriota bacterium]|nr:MAG: hypothetical protein DRP46_01280 [candidate division Zixibacteria bacterium]HDL03531.1 hypothetical protein [candidate division Zixibacteria bacterium]